LHGHQLSFGQARILAVVDDFVQRYEWTAVWKPLVATGSVHQ
jgi:hypothetical protein